jgi:phage FluMu gp28-like protein
MKLTSTIHLHEKAAFALHWIDIEKASGIQDAKWQEYQKQYLNIGNKQLAGWLKARQIAWSFTSAIDAVVDGILYPGNPHIFVSINQDEAKEKIRYAKAIIDAIHPDLKPTVVRDSLTEIEFANGSRFISNPCRPPRGKARSRIYLDEMAHYRRGLDREIYTASLPATTHGDGYVRIGSSPFGASGMFWELMSQSMREFKGFVRYITPWWTIGFLCKDIEMAVKVAPSMPTEERAYTFGTKALIQQFENMYLEDFQQEFECSWVDEAVSFISWDLIKACQDEKLLYWHAKNVDEAEQVILSFQQAIRTNRIEHAYVGGIDVGRTRNTTELFLVGVTNTEAKPLRLSVTLDNVEFDDQEDCFVHVIKELPITRVLVDKNGIGMQLAENLAKRTGKAMGVDFDNASKELWAVDLRLEFERRNIVLPLDRDISYQIHSIRKMKTASGTKNKYDTEGNEKHHADKFWALALAVSNLTNKATPLVVDKDLEKKSTFTGLGDREPGKWNKYGK